MSFHSQVGDKKSSYLVLQQCEIKIWYRAQMKGACYKLKKKRKEKFSTVRNTVTIRWKGV